MSKSTKKQRKPIKIDHQRLTEAGLTEDEYRDAKSVSWLKRDKAQRDVIARYFEVTADRLDRKADAKAAAHYAEKARKAADKAHRHSK